MAIQKKPGEQFGADINFEHQGAADTLSLTVYPVRQDGTYLTGASAEVKVGDDPQAKKYAANLRAVWPTYLNLPDGEVLNAQFLATSPIKGKVWSPPLELAVWQNKLPLISCSIYRAGGRWGVAPYWYCIWWTARLGAWHDDGIGWRDAYQPCQVSGVAADEDVYLVGYDWGPDVGWLGYGPHGPFKLQDKAYYMYNLGMGTLS